MDLKDKLSILTESAKYDVACTSSGSNRKGKKGALGNTVVGGICHSFASDGRCISLLKVLMTNICIYNCQYCVNRVSNDIRRAFFTPDELCNLTMEFYRRNYIEGLFLSSAVFKSPDFTMEMLYKTLLLLREKHNFNGYIHVKAIPGADDDLIRLTGFLADRMSVNIELPSEESLNRLAPDKSKANIIRPMSFVKNGILQSKNEVKLYKHAKEFVPAGQSTQMIIGASPDTDRKIIDLSENLYNKFKLKRVFYSAYMPVTDKNPVLPVKPPPLVREHRLYQADWLLRFYGFTANEIVTENENLSLSLDPKANHAIKHLELFPVEINTADYYTLLKVPGIGPTSAYRIMTARKHSILTFTHLKKLGVVLKRAKYFIVCSGQPMEKLSFNEQLLTQRLIDGKDYVQMSLFDNYLLEENKEETPIINNKAL